MRTGARLAFLAMAFVATAGVSSSFAAAPPCSYVDIGLNSSVDDALTTSDCPLSGTYADYYRFFAAAGTTITANLRAPALGDVLLSIQDFSTGNILAHDNEVSNASIQLKITVDAFYLVRVWSTDPSIPTGAYRLRLTGVKNTNGCTVDPDPSTLCVDSDRFKIHVDWNAVHQGTQGEGTAVSMTADTGSFWFFSADNVELVIKVLDARPINGHFWVFYGALTNVQYTVTVTDTLNGTVKQYSSPQDTQASVSDTSAF
jgi:hypothetical protein